MTSEDDPFHDCELDPEAILGTHTFEDVLFTDETETPVNVLTGETPAHSQATVEEAKEFAASIDTETPQIALPASVESQVEKHRASPTRRPHSSTSRRQAHSSVTAPTTPPTTQTRSPSTSKRTTSPGI
jgi:hypothetical protein